MKLIAFATRMLVCTVIAAGIMTLASPLSPAAAAKQVPRAVSIARTVVIPDCTLFVDAAFNGTGEGSVTRPFKTISAAVGAAANGAVICVAQGVYAESLVPGLKYFSLAGGFQRGKSFKVRNSATFVTKAVGQGGSFIRIVDPGPSGNQLTAIDGFDISGYSQAIYRDIYYSQRFDLTNNFIHDNVCANAGLAGAGFALNNVSGVIKGNVFARNRCGRGGAGFLNDSTNENRVTIARNRVESNAGDEPQSSHGGGLYLFTNRITLTGNMFLNNRVTGWGAGLYVGAFTAGGQPTTARLGWNIYRGNRAGIAGGGFFCDDGAACLSEHEIYDSNCGGNILLDSGPDDSGPTIARFDHLTVYNAKSVECDAPGLGVQIDKGNTAPDSYSFVNAIFWGNAPNGDLVSTCSTGCGTLSVSINYSIIRRPKANGGAAIVFGGGNLAPVNPGFVSVAKGDFHLKSIRGHWTAAGYVEDTVSSPALAKGDPNAAVPDNPPRAGNRTELGAYGNSAEASYVR